MTDQPLFCAYHPSRTTTLRCNRCGQPICTSCAILTPVGYRCKVCVRQQQKVFETAYWYNFLIAFVVAGVICGAGSLLGSLLGFFVILVAALVGTVAARAIQWAVRHRRSRYLLGCVCGRCGPRLHSDHDPNSIAAAGHAGLQLEVTIGFGGGTALARGVSGDRRRIPRGKSERFSPVR